MIIIENQSISGDSPLGLFKNLPKSVLGKLNVNSSYSGLSNGRVEVVVLYGEELEKVRLFIPTIGGTLENLGYGFGIVNIDVSKIGDLVSNPNIQYIELPKELYFSDANSNKAACVQRAQAAYEVTGKGVVIGFIDSGLDYVHPAFRNDDGTTRVEYIYDLSATGRPIYNREKINEALKTTEPYQLVPVPDLTEHGTHVVGIACAGGKIDPKYYGVAPESSIIMVKAGRGLFALSTQIMRGLKFLVDKSKEIGMPLAVNISLSTNDGAHNGTSLLEQYIQTIATLERITIVIAAGNEGAAAHHVGGKLNKENIIKFNVAEDESNVIINLYKSVLPSISLELITPTAVTTGEIIVQEGFKEGIIGENKYQILNTGPKPFDVSGEVGISITSGGNYIISGQWTIILRVKTEYEGIYDMWLPISEGLNQKTKFLQPTIENTLGIPATVKSVISVGSYNYLTNNISSFSGRGKEILYGEAKPDIVAPGENIISTAPDRRFDRKSGTSMAAPHVAGVCALLLQWGVIKLNDPYLYGDRLKYYIITGSRKERLDISYPDISWGYGEVCAFNALNNLTNILSSVGVRSPMGSDEFKMNREDDGFYSQLEKYKDSKEVVGFVVEYTSKEELLKVNKLARTSAIILDDSYGIIYTPYNAVNEIEPYIKKRANDINAPIYTLSNESPVEASNALTYHNNPYLSLNGNGVLIGIIDTGIDYLSEEFMKENDTTRIVRLWDQAPDPVKEVYGLKLGIEYTEEQINQAIKLQKSGGDPYSIVPSKDEIGHGTMVAGLSAARGINPDVVGAAPGASLAIVKLQQASNVALELAGITNKGEGRYEQVDTLVAVRYLSLLASELKMPLVVLVPLGTNTGAHDDSGVLESLINDISKQLGVVAVTGTGNEGDTDTHTQGSIEKAGDIKTIELKVGKNQKNLNFDIWISKPDTVAISIVSPSGEIIEKIPPKINESQEIRFIYEGTKMIINYVSPDYHTGDELITIRSKDIREGIWKFKLHGEYIVTGTYYSWLPQRSLLDPETKFLSPSQYRTLTQPGTSNQVVSVAYYNQNNNATVGSSGRGFTRTDRVKPDIAAGGINATIIRPGGTTGVASGSSVATSIVAGICAMILQWGIVDGNDEDLYATKVTSYIIRGAKMRTGDTYPNAEWGYGQIDMTGIFNAIRGNFGNSLVRGENSEVSKYEEYNVGELFVRKPL